MSYQKNVNTFWYLILEALYFGKFSRFWDLLWHCPMYISTETKMHLKICNARQNVSIKSTNCQNLIRKLFFPDKNQAWGCVLLYLRSYLNELSSLSWASEGGNGDFPPWRICTTSSSSSIELADLPLFKLGMISDASNEVSKSFPIPPPVEVDLNGLILEDSSKDSEILEMTKR